MHTEDDEGKMLGVKRVGKKEVGEDIHIYIYACTHKYARTQAL